MIHVDKYPDIWSIVADLVVSQNWTSSYERNIELNGRSCYVPDNFIIVRNVFSSYSCVYVTSNDVRDFH